MVLTSAERNARLALLLSPLECIRSIGSSVEPRCIEFARIRWDYARVASLDTGCSRPSVVGKFPRFTECRQLETTQAKPLCLPVEVVCTLPGDPEE